MRDTIQKRQNEEHMLKIQCSARGYYNNAERIGKLAWLFCLISAASLIIPESVPLVCQLTIPVIADIAALLLSKKQDPKDLPQEQPSADYYSAVLTAKLSVRPKQFFYSSFYLDSAFSVALSLPSASVDA